MLRQHNEKRVNYDKNNTNYFLNFTKSSRCAGGSGQVAAPLS